MEISTTSSHYEVATVQEVRGPHPIVSSYAVVVDVAPTLFDESTGLALRRRKLAPYEEIDRIDAGVELAE